MTAAARRLPSPSTLPSSASPPNVITPPASAPSVKVAQAGSVARMRSAYAPGASVSTIEKPHGDHAPVTPASSAVATTTVSAPLNTGSSSGST
jgi:hypothetical protein